MSKRDRKTRRNNDKQNVHGQPGMHEHIRREKQDCTWKQLEGWECTVCGDRLLHETQADSVFISASLLPRGDRRAAPR